jgi:hypothetical protein
LERLNIITEKFERLLNTTLATDYSLDGKLTQAMSEVDEIGTLDSLKLKDKQKLLSDKSLREFQNDTIRNLLKSVKTISLSNIQKNANKLQRHEIETLLHTSK